MLDQLSDQSLMVINVTLAVIVLILAVFAAVMLWQLKRMRQNFMLQNQPVNLEEILSGLAVKIRDLERGHLTLESAIVDLQNHLQLPIQKVGVIKFNSLANEGGNMSFVLALLDSDNSGILLTSMHGRDHNRIYTKVVSGGVSEIQLTEEEIQAMTQAQTKWQAHLKKDQPTKTKASPKRKKTIKQE